MNLCRYIKDKYLSTSEDFLYYPHILLKCYCSTYLDYTTYILGCPLGSSFCQSIVNNDNENDVLILVFVRNALMNIALHC